MITLTTSRDPARRTRSFAKVISRYMNWRYVQRGKRGLDDLLREFNHLIMVREIKGNPAFLDIFIDQFKILTIRMNVGIIRKEKFDNSPVYFAGDLDFDPLLLGALPKTKVGEKFALKYDLRKVVIVKKKRDLNFYFDDKLVLTMKILRIQHERMDSLGK